MLRKLITWWSTRKTRESSETLSILHSEGEVYYASEKTLTV